MPDPTWYELNPTNALPAGTQELLDSVNAALAGVTAVINAIEAMFEVVKLFVTDRVDVLKAALETIRSATASLIESLEEAGIYVLSYVPRSVVGGVRPSTWIRRVMASMVDVGDANRPEFATEQTLAGALVMVVGTDYPALMQQVSTLLTAFLRPVRTNSRLVATQFELEQAYGSNVNRGFGKGPDWEVMYLKDLFPVMADLAAVLKKLLGVLVYGEGLTTLIDRYVAFLSDKVALLSTLTTELSDVIVTFTALLEAGDATVLYWDGSYTTASLTAAVEVAGLPTGVDEVDDVARAAGFALVAAGAPTATVALIRGLLVG